MIKANKALILVNLGSPDSPAIPHVKSFLKVFLGDACVLTMPGALRTLLVNGIIAPFRAPRSAKLYEELWDDRGSPLIYHSKDLVQVLLKEPMPGADLYLAMRYGQPSLHALLQEKNMASYEEILVLPLFPQYAGSTVGSVMEECRRALKGHPQLERTRIITHFHEHPDFAPLWQRKITPFLAGNPDALLISFHGIPVAHAEGGHPGHSCQELRCTEEYGAGNRYCYQAACAHTARLISGGLDFPAEKLHLAYQSRFGKRWLGPQSVDVIRDLAASGCRHLVVACPSFVADCLETLVEIGEEYREVFLSAGGERLQLVPSLNAEPDWAAFIRKLSTAPGHRALPLEQLNCKGAKLLFR